MIKNRKLHTPDKPGMGRYLSPAEGEFYAEGKLMTGNVSGCWISYVSVCVCSCQNIELFH